MALHETLFTLSPDQQFYRGKVRDVYTIGDTLISVATDRISAFDHILSRSIPYKGQVLNQIAAHFLQSTSDIIPNWLQACPHPNVSVGHRCKPIRLEMVVRGYLVGHAWRQYNKGIRELCGVKLPEGLRKNQAFENPIITPATKAESGHDEDIAPDEIISRQIVDAKTYQQLASYSQQLFTRGQEMAKARGLILVDTKYEFGWGPDGTIMLIDEIHTPDSSRYFLQSDYKSAIETDRDPAQLSKEFVREWLMDHGFQGRVGDIMPEMNDAFVNQVSLRYIDLYEKITGKRFIKAPQTNIADRIKQNIQNYLSE